MEVLIFAIIALLVLSAVDALASEVGVDSRDLSDDPHRPSYPVSLS